MNEQEKTQQYYTDIVATMAERIIKRLWIVIILLIVLLVGTNAGWLWYESQWETVSTTESYEAQAEESGIAIVNRDGEVNYGTSQVHQNDKNP